MNKMNKMNKALVKLIIQHPSLYRNNNMQQIGKALTILEKIDIDEVIDGLNWKLSELEGTSIERDGGLAKTREMLKLFKEVRDETN